MNFTTQRHIQSRGFTLIEIIIAISILAIIVGIAYGSFSQILRSKIILDDQSDVDSIGQTLMSRLAHELQSAYKAALLPECGEKQTATTSEYFRGHKDSSSDGQSFDSVTFITRDGGQYMPDGGTHTGDVQLQYLVAPDPDNANTPTLYRREIPVIRPVDRACENKLNFPIVGNISSLSFRYYDSQNSKWLDTWGSETTQSPMPRFVYIKAKIKSPRGEIHSYETMVATRGE